MFSAIKTLKMGPLLLIFMLFCLFNQGKMDDGGDRDEDEEQKMINMNTTQFIQHSSYFVEEHKVKTSDNYELTVFRIPRGKKG